MKLSSSFHSVSHLTLSPSLCFHFCLYYLSVLLFLIPLMSFKHFFFLSITSVPLFFLSLSICWSLFPSASSSLSLCFLLVFLSSDFSLFFPLSDKIYVCPPTLIHTCTNMHRCTDPPLSFHPSYLDLYQDGSSGPLPALLRGTQLSG